MNSEEIRQQSENAYNQHKVKWRANAKTHSKEVMHDLMDLAFSGMGKAALCVANGYSFEHDIEVIKEKQNQVDIICCDKTLGHCIDNGIIPKYCMVCDAVVDYETYMRPWEDKLEGVTLLLNACGNPKWSQNGNWKKKYFFVNKDILKSEDEFCKISGCNNVIPAGTNVSNAMVIILTQSDESGYRNFFGYDKILLSGFDYAWPDEKYYSFNHSGDGKNNYMRHIQTMNKSGKMCYTSGNLMFSARWMSKYVQTFGLPVVQCSPHSIMNLKNSGKLSEQMDYSFKTGNALIMRGLHDKKLNLINEIKNIDCIMKKTIKSHINSYLSSI